MGNGFGDHDCVKKIFPSPDAFIPFRVMYVNHFFQFPKAYKSERIKNNKVTEMIKKYML